MRKVIRLTESDLVRIVKKVIQEQPDQMTIPPKLESCMNESGINVSDAIRCPNCVKLLTEKDPYKYGQSCYEELQKNPKTKEKAKNIITCVIKNNFKNVNLDSIINFGTEIFNKAVDVFKGKNFPIMYNR